MKDRGVDYHNQVKDLPHMNRCYWCNSELDYSGVIYKIDVQKWLRNKAIGLKLTLCSDCGDRFYGEDMLRLVK